MASVSALKQENRKLKMQVDNLMQLQLIDDRSQHRSTSSNQLSELSSDGDGGHRGRTGASGGNALGEGGGVASAVEHVKFGDRVSLSHGYKSFVGCTYSLGPSSCLIPLQIRISLMHTHVLCIPPADKQISRATLSSTAAA